MPSRGLQSARKGNMKAKQTAGRARRKGAGRQAENRQVRLGPQWAPAPPEEPGPSVCHLGVDGPAEGAI